MMTMISHLVTIKYLRLLERNVSNDYSISKLKAPKVPVIKYMGISEIPCRCQASLKPVVPEAVIS